MVEDHRLQDGGFSMSDEFPSPLIVDGVQITSINQINDLPSEERERLYRELVPPEVFARFDIDPTTGRNATGHEMVTCPVSFYGRGAGLSRLPDAVGSPKGV